MSWLKVVLLIVGLLILNDALQAAVGSFYLTGVFFGNHLTKTAAFNIDSTLCGWTVQYNSSSPANATVQNTTKPDCTVDVFQMGTGVITIVPQSGATQNSICATVAPKQQYAGVGIYVASNAGSAAVYNVYGQCA
jgi:hypothetical protein